MIFIRERQEFTRYPFGLQDIERRQSFSNWESIVQLIVNDQVGRSPVLQVPGWIPLFVIFPILPKRSCKVVMGEEQLFGRILIQSTENSVVRDKGLEFASQLMALNPIHHIPTIAGAKSNSTRDIDVWKVVFNVLESFDEVDVWAASPVVPNPVLECHTVPSRTGGIWRDNNVALLCEYGGVPSCRPSFIPCSLRLGKS